jgi:hypothetical protein
MLYLHHLLVHWLLVVKDYKINLMIDTDKILNYYDYGKFNFLNIHDIVSTNKWIIDYNVNTLSMISYIYDWYF